MSSRNRTSTGVEPRPRTGLCLRALPVPVLQGFNTGFSGGRLGLLLRSLLLDGFSLLLGHRATRRFIGQLGVLCLQDLGGLDASTIRYPGAIPPGYERGAPSGELIETCSAAPEDDERDWYARCGGGGVAPATTDHPLMSVRRSDVPVGQSVRSGSMNACTAAIGCRVRDEYRWTRAVRTASTARDWFGRSPRRLSLVGGVGGLTMIGLGVAVAVTGRKE